jgi:predicted TPR repeat methyltransferase
LADLPPSSVLDLGCSGGELAVRLRKLGHHVTGVDAEEVPGIYEHVDEFVKADLGAGLPDSLTGPFDVIVAADVLEHVARPEALLDDVGSRLAPGGRVVVSIPNFAHWYPRLRVVLGLFDYDRRGILDVGHLRFFTRRSFERMARKQGFVTVRCHSVGVPIEVTKRGGKPGPNGSLGRRLAAIDRVLVVLRPNLFAYQYVFRLEPHVAAGSGASGGDGEPK